MTGRVLGAGALGGLVLFFVGFLWWGLPVGPGSAAVRHAPREVEFQALLAEHLPESGTYFVPAEGMGDDEAAMEAHVERHRKGPIAMVVFHRGGKEPFDPMVMAAGFAHGVIASVLAAAFLCAVGAGRGFRGRWGIVCFLGGFLMFFDDLAGLIWWSETPAWVAVQGGYNLVGWALAALPIAAIVKPRPPAA